MKNKLKEEKGFSLIVLSAAIIILILITGVLVYNTKDSMDIKQLNNMRTDISVLQDKIENYVKQYGAIPGKVRYTNLSNMQQADALGINDNEVYYVIDLKAIKNLSLNYGEQYSKVANEADSATYTDLYIVNEQSHQIYYPKGITVDNITYYGLEKDNNQIEMIDVGLPKTNETTPYLPDEDSIVLENDLAKGVVVKDKNKNEWTWIEVPKSITQNATTDTEIYTALENYTVDYRGVYKDTWYEGCGLTESEYNANKGILMQSIKNNGGFWITRYEAGVSDDQVRTSHTEITQSSPKAVSIQNKVPYTYVTCSEAQMLSQKMTPSTAYTSSLMYGIQWDLICKYIEIKGEKTQADLKTDSTGWGNYSNSTFSVEKGKYSEDNGTTWKITIPYTKASLKNVLLSTGIIEQNKVLNVYDFAGNESEWTLENGNHATNLSAARGGDYTAVGTGFPTVNRTINPITSSFQNIGFRATMY